MSHTRTGIRSACVQSLTTAAIVAAGNVFSNRAQALFGFTLPAINVVTLEESSEPDTVSDTPLRRKLQLAIDCYAPASETLDDDLDDLAEDIEGVLQDVTASLGSSAIDAFLTDTVMDLAQVGDEPCGVMRLVYEVSYIA